ncbi:sensor histidine kinase [Corynebacterium cystitidis]|uniref:sensor histidine kinase n=1 Tax=Corynebacterium cystitidis TaxID=35757 RepID=UPI00211DCAC1|nr:histidine kinase [Corynebacterium cystitidis]
MTVKPTFSLRRWRHLDPADKFLAYNRWSLILTLLITPVITVAIWRGTLGRWVLPVLCISMISALLVCLFLHTQPALRVDAAAPGRRPLYVAAAAQIIIIGFSLVALGLGDRTFGASSRETGTALVLLVFLSLINLVTGITPFLVKSAAWTAVVTVIGVAWVLLYAGMASLALIVALFSILTPSLLWTVRLMIETHRARFLEAQLQISEERLRFAQDLHDTMGQHLAAISIKVQLAQKLAALNDDRLGHELQSLGALTDQAAGDMRQVVQAYQHPDLTKELAGAISVLKEAGIAVTLEGAAPEIPEHAREVAAWFIRETATNVLRHSMASWVRITLTSQGIAITNNNPRESGSEGPRSKAHDGSTLHGGQGLDSLRRRAQAISATIAVEHTATTFEVELHL